MLSHQDKQVTADCDIGLIPADERRECTHLSIKITADRQQDTEFLGIETALSLTQYYYHNFVKRRARIQQPLYTITTTLLWLPTKQSQ